jgi:hypothetical protein
MKQTRNIRVYELQLSIPFASASGLGPGLFASVCLPSFSGSTIRDGVWPTQGSS